MNTKVGLDYSVKEHVKGLKTEDGNPHVYKLQSQASNFRGMQLLCEKVNGKVYAVPIVRNLAMRNTVENERSASAPLDSKKATKGEIVKQLESRLRTFQFQQEILGLEAWAEYRMNRTKNNGVIDIKKA